MKVKVVFDADGTTTKFFTGYHISTQAFPKGRLLLKISDKKGKVTFIFQASKYYYVEKRK